MDTGAKNDDGRSEEESSLEPLGLSATAMAGPPDSKPRAVVPPEHQQAVELVIRARMLLRQDEKAEARALFMEAALLEQKVLRTVKTQPESSLIAGFGARAALQCGDFELVHAIVRKGSRQASELMQWSLFRVSIEADLLEFMREFDRDWEVVQDFTDEDESSVLLVSSRGLRLLFELDPESTGAVQKDAQADGLIFVIPAERLSRQVMDALERLVSQWMSPKLRPQTVLELWGVGMRLPLETQTVLERLGLETRFLSDPVPV